jgi:hypothetical protein
MKKYLIALAGAFTLALTGSTQAQMWQQQQHFDCIHLSVQCASPGIGRSLNGCDLTCATSPPSSSIKYASAEGWLVDVPSLRTQQGLARDLRASSYFDLAMTILVTLPI